MLCPAMQRQTCFAILSPEDEENMDNDSPPLKTINALISIYITLLDVSTRGNGFPFRLSYAPRNKLALYHE